MFFFACKDLGRTLVVARRDHHFGEHLGYLFGHGHTHRAVRCDHAAECTDRI